MTYAKNGDWIVFTEAYTTFRDNGSKLYFKRGDVKKVIDSDSASNCYWFNSYDLANRVSVSSKINIFSDQMVALNYAEELLEADKRRTTVSYSSFTTSTSEAYPYNFGDRVVFAVDGKTYAHRVERMLLKPTDIRNYGEIFKALGMDKDQKVTWCNRVYGYSETTSTAHGFPEYRKNDIKAANKVIEALKEECRKFNRRKQEESSKKAYDEYIKQARIELLEGQVKSPRQDEINHLRQNAPRPSTTSRGYRPTSYHDTGDSPSWLKDITKKPSSYTQRVGDPSTDSLEVKRLPIRKKRKKS